MENWRIINDMRDINRIDKFCENLAESWKRLPDWRFGQLMMNLLGQYYTDKKRDPFFTEDDEMIKFIEEYTRYNGPYPQEEK